MHLFSSLETFTVFLFITGSEQPQSRVPGCIVFPPQCVWCLGFIEFPGEFTVYFTCGRIAVIMSLNIFFRLSPHHSLLSLRDSHWHVRLPGVVLQIPVLCSVFMGGKGDGTFSSLCFLWDDSWRSLVFLLQCLIYHELPPWVFHLRHCSFHPWEGDLNLKKYF